MKKRKNLYFMAVLVFILLFLGFVSNVEAVSAKNNFNREKYKKFEKVMTKTINKWGRKVKFKDSTYEEIDEFCDIFLGNPKYFYISYLSSGLRSVGDSKSETITVTIRYIKNAKKKMEKYEKEVSSILRQVDPAWSDFEKVVFINDYLTVNCEYDNAYEEYDSYGAIVKRRAVCEGYAKAFMDLMGRLSVPCKVVESDWLFHAWNIVKVDGNWYHVDVTWNDPVPDTKGNARHYYLLKSTLFFQDENRGGHDASDYKIRSGEYDTVDFDYSVATDTKYDDYFWNDVNVPFIWNQGKWYGISSETKEVTRYAYVNEKGGFVKEEVVLRIEDKWPVWDKAGWTWQGCYSQFAWDGELLYYSNPNKIYSYKFKDGIRREIATIDTSNGFIYGLVKKNGKLIYYIGKAPGEEYTGEGTIDLE